MNAAFNKQILRFLSQDYSSPFLVSTDFAWWLLLTMLSRIPYAFGFAACLVAPSSSGTIPDAHICC